MQKKAFLRPNECILADFIISEMILEKKYCSKTAPEPNKETGIE